MEKINYENLAKEMAKWNIKATYFAYYNANRKKLKEALKSTYLSIEDDEDCHFRFFECIAEWMFWQLHFTDFFDELL